MTIIPQVRSLEAWRWRPKDAIRVAFLVYEAKHPRQPRDAAPAAKRWGSSSVGLRLAWTKCVSVCVRAL